MTLSFVALALFNTDVHVQVVVGRDSLVIVESPQFVLMLYVATQFTDTHLVMRVPKDVEVHVVCKAHMHLVCFRVDARQDYSQLVLGLITER